MPNFVGPGHRDVPMIEDTSLAVLLAGTQLPPGAGPELRPLVEALAGLRARPVIDELAGEAETLAAFRNHFGAPRMADRPPARTPPARRRLLPVKAAAAAATILSLGGLATAAYAGALPATVQRFAHDIAGAPAPGSQPALTPSSAHRATTDGPAYGLCTAWALAKAHGIAAQRAAAFSRLAAAAGGAGKVTAYCATAAPPGMSPSQAPQPSPAPHATGKPTRIPAPHASGKPRGLPGPHGTGAPTVRPTPHSTGKPSGPRHPAPAVTKKHPSVPPQLFTAEPRDHVRLCRSGGRASSWLRGDMGFGIGSPSISGRSRGIRRRNVMRSGVWGRSAGPAVSRAHF